MTTYFITGGSGFIGRRIIERLRVVEPDATILVLVRENTLPRFSRYLASAPELDQITPVVGNLTAPGLGLGAADLPDIDHVIHLAAIYDMTADADAQHAANVEGTARVADFAQQVDAMLHHVSSIAVSGDHRGTFTEHDFDCGQGFPTPYHRTKFAAEKLVREREGLRWRIYRPSVVVGDSHTGEMDKIDGPYYFFGHLRLLGALPHSLPLPMPDLGHVNIVPVDYVANGIVALCSTQPGRSGQVFHLADPRRRTITDMYNAIAPGFRGPRGHNVIPRALVEPLVTVAGSGVLRVARDLVATQQGIPPALLDGMSLTADFRSDDSVAALRDRGIELPDLDDYGPRLWTYWSRHLDPARHRRTDPRGPLVGKHVLITGGSTGIGKATARMCVARGADVFIVARDRDALDAAVAELSATGSKEGVPPGRVFAYPCDITDEEAVAGLVKTVLAEHDHVDVLVNNAGRSIRRAAVNSTDRLHDHHRLMAVNYFGAVTLTLALLPHMVARQSGHVVNVSSVAVQSRGPRFGAYAASKAALEAFSEATRTETLSDHVTFSNVRLPLVRTRMIAPTHAYDNQAGIWGVDKAASRVLHAITERPYTVNSPIGVLAEVGHLFAGRLTTRVMHQEYLMIGESAAALGNSSDAER
ncbi:SDR family oxidoreductase [Gordonia sp. HNM0687]|uniref:SDR family oxidoreductase n=1 Tax=Gordonia mangrovi TaxID=2665643 RepID=A0A6L7GSS3_9ACTN|nr:SDR family oxidoreductase [Gordonia mangrovi]MXP23059.1 SDR family oxidoreductase [Gordonia mangrovi]UVF77348.1 SDR family oxidoreductase [Gordonia mangrovi]